MKILFIHGLASSGAYKMADSLRILLKPCEVIAPDVPIEPDKALALLQGICRELRPDLVVGLSLGGFWAQKLRGQRKILVNPSFHISRLMRTMVGEVEYLSPRADGAASFTITPEICDAYEALEATQFEGITPEEMQFTRGLFADADERVRCGDEFELHYPGRGLSYPGTHLPNFPELKKYLVPAVGEMLQNE
ncbi:MAG: hypothetical protein K6F25_10930 [Bacteroidales bacterium]|nr:hypothetical protein [Bacteroidales bacterium]